MTANTRRPELSAAADGLPATKADLYVANSGTTIRFLTAMLSLGQGTYRLDGTPRMRERPIGDLLDALGQLGADAVSEHGNGCPPVIVRGRGLAGRPGNRGRRHFQPVSERLAHGGALCHGAGGTGGRRGRSSPSRTWT